MYRIVRMYFKGARAHCNDPETSSRTATGAAAKRRTRERGEWFDGYEECKCSTRRSRITKSQSRAWLASF